MPVLSCTKLTNPSRQLLKQLAWQVIDCGLAGKGLKLPEAPSNEDLQTPAACFVTLLYNGQLRGCIGSLDSTEPLWMNVCRNAYVSGFRDNRFEPICLHDRANLSLEISILSELVSIPNEGEQALREKLQPGVDGLVLQQGNRRAVFLPLVWDKIPTPELFINALKCKGGWLENYWSNDILIHIFTTEVINGESSIN